MRARGPCHGHAPLPHGGLHVGCRGHPPQASVAHRGAHPSCPHARPSHGGGPRLRTCRMASGKSGSARSARGRTAGVRAQSYPGHLLAAGARARGASRRAAAQQAAHVVPHVAARLQVCGGRARRGRHGGQARGDVLQHAAHVRRELRVARVQRHGGLPDPGQLGAHVLLRLSLGFFSALAHGRLMRARGVRAQRAPWAARSKARKRRALLHRLPLAAGADLLLSMELLRERAGVGRARACARSLLSCCMSDSRMLWLSAGSSFANTAAASTCRHSQTTVPRSPRCSAAPNASSYLPSAARAHGPALCQDHGTGSDLRGARRRPDCILSAAPADEGKLPEQTWPLPCPVPHVIKPLHCTQQSHHGRSQQYQRASVPPRRALESAKEHPIVNGWAATGRMSAHMGGLARISRVSSAVGSWRASSSARDMADAPRPPVPAARPPASASGGEARPLHRR